MKRTSFLIASRSIVLQLIIISTFVFASFFVYAGTFYSCVDKEGNETLSDYPVGGKTCKPIGEFKETKSTQEENTTRERGQSAYSSSSDRTTNIIAKGNRVVVPATLVYGKNEVDVQFVMDTGATGTAINTDIADRLSINLSKARKGKAGVVGGTIEVSVVRINSLTIGPHTIRDCSIAVIPQEGYTADYDGLLGMDVLGQFSFRV